eukprot:GILJ01024932.1.p1 GENE.GILJ01024932.1~~GILJ01024932.1.p1  ORF type:complete len:394 (-),score=46.35 GILJ01024932.1:244-1326(-)
MVVDGLNMSNSGLSNRSFCSLEGGGGEYASPSGMAQASTDTPINNGSFNNNSHGYGLSSINTSGLIDTVEMWTVEVFSEVTKGQADVATIAQMAGLCRILCAHSTLNPLPTNLHRVGQLHQPGPSSGPSGSTANSFVSDEFYVPTVTYNGDSTNSGSSYYRQWHVLSAAGKSCLTVTWQLNPSAVNPTPNSARRMSLLRNSSPAPQPSSLPAGEGTSSSRNVLVGSFGTVTGSFGVTNPSLKRLGDSNVEVSSDLATSGAQQEGQAKNATSNQLTQPPPLSPRPPTSYTPNTLRPLTQPPTSGITHTVPTSQAGGTYEAATFALMAACECVQSSTGGGPARDSIDEYKRTVKRLAPKRKK